MGSGPLLPISCPRCNHRVLYGEPDQKATFEHQREMTDEEYHELTQAGDPLSPWFFNFTGTIRYFACQQCMETRIPHGLRSLFRKNENLVSRCK